MRFSVITITFNAESYLRETLDSVAKQEFNDFEHIVWDGGSTDQTLQIAKSYSHVILHQGEDGGIADGMNRGSAFAKGDFLLHLHADDLLLHPRVLAMVDKTLRLHPRIEWLYGKARIIDCKGEKLRDTPYEPYQAKRLRKYNFITHPATYVSRTLFQRVGGFDPGLRYCMDYDLWLRLASYCEPLALPVPLASFRQHQKSLSTSEPLAVANEGYQVRNRYAQSLLERYRSWRTWKKRLKKNILSD